MERVADYVIKKIHQSGVNHIFMVTGRGILFLSDAVAKEPEMEAISTYHEQGASYAAMAYAQSNESLGACLVSTGCAATNAITAALCAWQDNVPVIFISGQHMLEETTHYTKLPIRTYGSQEADIISLVKPITKYSVMLTDASQTAVELEKAIYYATHGRKGPVWIDIPLNIQNARVAPEKLIHYDGPIENVEVSTQDVLDVVSSINTAKCPLILIGGGVRSSGAVDLVHRLVEKTGIPLIFTPAAADAYGTAHELSVGAVGSIGGSRAGNFAMQNADYLLVIGSKMCSQVTGRDYDNFAPRAKVDIIDIDKVEHRKTEIEHNFIHGDATDFLGKLLKETIRLNNVDWQQKCMHWKQVFSVEKEAFVQELIKKNQIDLYLFADELGNSLPANATVITDAGFEELIIPSTVHFGKEQRCLFPAAQGAMGYAIPAILGGHYAGRENIVAVVGDGSIMMNMQELLIIAKKQIPVKIFVINNNMYAVIRKRQKDLFRTRTIGNDPSDGLPAPSFESIASSFGFAYTKIECYREITEQLDTVMALDKPIICEVMCIADQKYLHKSYAMNEKRRLEYRPLDDLSPFIDRDKLANEKLVIE